MRRAALPILLALTWAAAAAATEITVRGRLVDTAGAPLAGAAVELHAPLRSYDAGNAQLRDVPPFRATRSGDGGDFTLKGPAGIWRLRVTADGFRESWRVDVLVRSQELEPHRLLRPDERPDSACVVEVRDAAGHPVPAALVRGERDGRLLGLTDAAGRLETRVLKDSEGFVLAAESADGATAGALLRRLPEDGAPVVLTLAPPDLVRGRVTARGEPLGGAFVYLRDAPRHAVTSAADGTFVLPVQAARQAMPRRRAPTLVAAAEGHFDAVRELPRDAATALVVLELEPQSRLAGRVVDEAGRPVDGAAVEASPMHTEGAGGTQKVRSGEAGDFTLPVRANQVQQLSVRHPGFLPTRLQAGLDPARPNAVVEVVLRRSRRGFGFVLDEREQPLAGAQVVVLPSTREGPVQRPEPSITDAEGRFFVDGLPPDEALDMAVRAPFFADATVRGIRGEPSEDGLDLGGLVLDRGYDVTGWVLDQDGEPITDVRVGAHPALDAPGRTYDSLAQAFPPREATTTDGSFVLGPYSWGDRVRVAARSEGYFESGPVVVEVPADDEAVLVLRQAAQVRGRVVDPAGRPAAGAAVSIMALHNGSGAGRSVATDDNGHFEQNMVQPGRLEVTASADGYASAYLELEVAPGAVVDDVRLELRTGVDLRGRVVRAGQGHAVAGARVELVPDMDRAAGVPFRELSTDADGWFEATGLTPGWLQLTVEAAGYRPESHQFELQAGLEPIGIELQPAPRVEGRVVDPQGQGLAGAQVALLRDGSTAGTSTTAVDGSFTFDEARAGTYEWQVSAPGWALAAGTPPVEVTDAGVRDLVLRVERHQAAIAGVVGGADGDVRLALFNPRWRNPMPSAETTADVEGHYRFDQVAPGEWEVVATELGSGREARRLVPVARNGGEVVANLELSGAFTLRGTLTGAAERAHVQVQGLDVDVDQRTSVDGAGRFTSRGLPAGRYRLTVRTPAAVHVREIDVDRDLEVAIDLRSYRLNGRVVDVAGRPLFDAHVLARAAIEQPGASASQRTAKDGTFALQPLGEGVHDLRVTLQGYAVLHREVAVGPASAAEEVTLRLERETVIELEVARADGQPAERLSVAVLDAAGGLRSQSFVKVESGRARLRGVPAGDGWLAVQAAGTAAAMVPVTAPGTATVVLPPPANLAVRVPALEGRRVLGSVTLRGDDGRPFTAFVRQQPRTAWPLRLGKAEVEGLPPGSWRVTVTSSDGVREGQVQVPTGGGDLELVLP